GNVVIPDSYIQQWGADTFRMYLMFLGPFQEGGDFRETGIVGIRRFLDKVWTTAHEAAAELTRGSGLPPEVARKLHQTIKKVTADTESLDYNTAIAAMMEYMNLVREQGAGSRLAAEPLLIMLAPYAPISPRSCGRCSDTSARSSRRRGPRSTSGSPQGETWRWWCR